MSLSVLLLSEQEAVIQTLTGVTSHISLVVPIPSGQEPSLYVPPNLEQTSALDAVFNEHELSVHVFIGVASHVLWYMLTPSEHESGIHVFTGVDSHVL
tara:strand:- start:1843 stop:2136 length:294 start_codon:yes stop_codon:yes gene_type:complete